MAQIKVFDKSGKEIKGVEVNSEIFEGKINGRLLEQVDRLYANNKRTGNAHTKTRGEVRGGGKKPWRQKGTGRARVSSIRSPLWRGGGTTFGPRSRTILNAIPKQIRRKALINSLRKKFREESIVLLDNFKFDEEKTKSVAKALESNGLANKKIVLMTSEHDVVINRIARNIPNLKIIAASNINAYEILRKGILLTDEAGIKAIESRILCVSDEEIDAKETVTA